ncbi:NAD-dependent succinate-semialdehyde dehydrogenase [Stenotrophomonas sp. W1S232]|uniref:NAD-dependent succinate-semialdehyde dehydrogenase n=1 Tax=Stenotrophomonas koreensis TaxID=266128 RepID=A0A7W3UZM0_9GAMM|nr:NAD-dependent succinate-semialdehyde dehydrogenase [Stenotrophomonas koreensis]MBB1116317.1 NAD-dependent succinate-semialdehyde dehydrogenase [Stenotrophomonas koreensis]
MNATPNPYTGQVEHQQRLDDAAQLEQRIASATAAFAGWSSTPWEQRAGVLRRAAQALRVQAPELAALMRAEMGKLQREGVAEINKCASVCEYYADHAQAMLADEPIVTEARRSYVRHEPLGCVLAVMPWNFPFWQVFRFLAPALMAGNVALLKHAANVPRCADAIARLLAGAGLPDGVFGVLHIDNEQTATVVADRRIRAVSLTGSERAGSAVAANAGRHLKKCVLELGGSDAFIVLADADLEAAVAAAAASRFDNAGQTCIAAKRFIVLPEVADAFVRGLVHAAGQRVYGDPADAQTSLAPMARADLRDELDRQVRQSVAAGAQVLIGGAPLVQTHAGYPATVLDHVAAGMPAYAEELFGPVAAVIRVPDVATAIAVANDTDYGLGGSVWGADVQAAEAVTAALQCGAAFVNAPVRSDPRLPFGGCKRSGFGRELGRAGLLELVNSKTVYLA